MNFAHRFDKATVEQILEVWADDGFYQDFAREMKVAEYRVSVERPNGGLEVTEHVAFSTRGVPQPFRSMLGERLEVDWVTDFGIEDGGAAGRIRATAMGDRMVFEPTAELRPESSAVTWQVDGTPQLRGAGLLAGVATSRLSGFLEDVLKAQARVTESWLRKDDRSSTARDVS